MERLSDYLPSHRHGMLAKIFLAQRLEQAIQAIAPGLVKVVIRGRTVHLVCVEAPYAKRLSLERVKIEQLITQLTHTPRPGYQLKIKVS